ncbi:PAAR domain-containing protein [Pseudomonas putida]|nr:PAAR domain-containing protein [Pseudomonas putida]MDD1969156.1 PAAR domain-containing protein [Pseudomonas putida]
MREQTLTRHLILKGDKTTHGGEVIECSPISRVGGIGVARVGDAVTCPIHGNTVIDTGDGALLLQGQSAARHGDSTACGASLIASQASTYRP